MSPKNKALIENIKVSGLSGIEYGVKGMRIGKEG
jgi:hypothetical protein